MGDTGMPNHGSIIVTIKDEEFIIDTSILNEQPIELTNIKKENAIHPVQVIHDTPKITVLFEFVMSKKQMPWIFIEDNISTDMIQLLHETSIKASLFNDCVYIRKNSKHIAYSIIGNTFYTKTTDKIQAQIFNKNEMKNTLIKVFGLSEEITNHISQTNLFDVPKQSMLLDLIK
jgi:DNA-directed RNA polymerase subunit H (RpoH/RPB5)